MVLLQQLLPALCIKGIINQAGISFSGHTEYFAQQSDTADVVMLLATEGLRVALVTTHIPLAYVSKAITPERLSKVIHILNHDLQTKFGIEQPRVLVCGSTHMPAKVVTLAEKK